MAPYDQRKHYHVHRRAAHGGMVVMLLIAVAVGYYINELHHPVTLDFCAVAAPAKN